MNTSWFETVGMLREQLLQAKLQLIENKFAMEAVRTKLRSADEFLAYEQAIDRLIAQQREENERHNETLIKKFEIKTRGWNTTSETTGRTIEPLNK